MHPCGENDFGAKSPVLNCKTAETFIYTSILRNHIDCLLLVANFDMHERLREHIILLYASYDSFISDKDVCHNDSTLLATNLELGTRPTS